MRRTRFKDPVPTIPATRLDRALSARIIGDDDQGIAPLIREARTRARLTQQQLARLVGTTQPAIARLENGAYRGHSLGMLQRIAAALGCDLELRLARRR